MGKKNIAGCSILTTWPKDSMLSTDIVPSIRSKVTANLPTPSLPAPASLSRLGARPCAAQPRLPHGPTPPLPRPLCHTVMTPPHHPSPQVLALCRAVQRSSPVNSAVLPIPGASAGYGDEVIFADGTFVEGSTLELSADGWGQPPRLYVASPLPVDTVPFATPPPPPPPSSSSCRCSHRWPCHSTLHIPLHPLSRPFAGQAVARAVCRLPTGLHPLDPLEDCARGGAGRHAARGARAQGGLREGRARGQGGAVFVAAEVEAELIDRAEA
eukprot:scaffold20218_cov109-Isochrysis_galbana.AAC.2